MEICINKIKKECMDETPNYTDNNQEEILEPISYLDPQFYVKTELTEEEEEEEHLSKTPTEKNLRTMATKINIKKLIAEVKSRPGLWDTTHEDYKDKTKKKELWEEVVAVFLNGESTEEEMEEMVYSLQRKWKSLRNSYTREIQQKLKSDSSAPRKQYVFFNQLSFLQNVVKIKNSSNISEENGSEICVDDEHSPTSSSSERVCGARKRNFVNYNVHAHENSMEGDDESEMEMNIDIEMLIEEIQARPALWDISHKDYRNKIKRKHIWKQLVDLFLESTATQEEKKEMVTSLQRKWKSLRNSYTREIQQKLKSNSSAPRKEYVFFNKLSFLQNVVKIKNGSSLIDDNTALYSPEVIMEDEQPDLPTTKKRKITPQHEQMENTLNSSTGFQSSENSMEEDDDRLFLLSLLKQIKKIPEHLRFGTRMQIMQVIDTAVKGNNQQLHHHQQNYFSSSHLGMFPGQGSLFSSSDTVTSPLSSDSHPSI